MAEQDVLNAIAALQPDAVNYCTNPSFETWTAGETSLPDGWVCGGGAGVPTYSRVPGRRGGSALRIQYTGVAGDSVSAWDWYIPTAVGSFAEADPVTVAYYVSGELSGCEAYFSARVSSEANFYLATHYSMPFGPLSLSSEPSLSSVSVGSLDATTILVRATLSVVAVDEGDTIDIIIEDVLISKSAVILPFFDGDSPGCSWASTAHASTSTRPYIYTIAAMAAESVWDFDTRSITDKTEFRVPPELPYNGAWVRHPVLLPANVEESSVAPDGDGWQMWSSDPTGLKHATSDELLGPWTMGPVQTLTGPGSGNYCRARVRQIGGTYHAVVSCNPDNIWDDYGEGQQLDHFTSPDGLTWTLSQAAILTVSDVVTDWDGHWITNSDFWLADGTYYMLYEGGLVAPNSIDAIGMATAPSMDGPWTKYAGNPVIGTPHIEAARPSLLEKDGTYYCWFIGCHETMMPTDIGRAHASVSDPFTWTIDVVDDAGGVVLFGREGAEEYEQAADPSVIEDNGLLYMFYTGRSSAHGPCAVWKVATTRPDYRAEAIVASAASADAKLNDVLLKTNTLGGAGAIAWPYTLTVNGMPCADAAVWVTSDEAGNNVVASGRTDDFGALVPVPNLDAGTYYFRAKKAGVNFEVDIEVVA